MNRIRLGTSGWSYNEWIGSFYPDNKIVEVQKGTSILSAAISAGVHINSICGGDGVCGKCKIILKEGEVISQSTALLTKEEKELNYYLACITEVHSDLVVEVPESSRIGSEVIAQARKDLGLVDLYSEPEDLTPSPSVLGD